MHQRSSHLMVLVATVALGAVSCSFPETPDLEGTVLTRQDERLIRSVLSAADEQNRAETVEARIGETAWLNTTRGNESLTLLLTQIVPDAEWSRGLVSLDGARDVVYWGRPGPWKSPRVIGLAWFDDPDDPEAFFALLELP